MQNHEQESCSAASHAHKHSASIVHLPATGIFGCHHPAKTHIIVTYHDYTVSHCAAFSHTKCDTTKITKSANKTTVSFGNKALIHFRILRSVVWRGVAKYTYFTKPKVREPERDIWLFLMPQAPWQWCLPQIQCQSDHFRPWKV